MNIQEERELAIINNETSLLGLLIREPNCYLTIAEILKPEMFHFKNNQILFKSISEVHNASKQFDIANLLSYLNDQKLIDHIGSFGYNGSEYISWLTKNAGFSAELESYAKKIIDQYKKDRLRDLLNSSINIMENKPYEISDLLSNLQLNLINLDISEINTAYEQVGNKADELFNRIMSKEKSDIGVGLSFGFPPLDELILGANPGDLIILAARPAMGKTAFALNIANNVAKNNKTVLFFSLEMSNSQIVQRMMSIDSLVPISLMRKNEISTENAKNLAWTVSEMKQWKMYLNDKPTSTISDITTIAKRFARNNKVDLVVVDYLQLMSDSSKASMENRQLEVSKISRSLKQLARELECPVLALSQLSRNVEKREDKTPILSDLRESGTIEQDADMVIFLHRKDYYNKHNINDDNDKAEAVDKSEIVNGSSSLTNVIVAKNRHGAIGIVQLLFQPECNRFIYEKKRN